VTDGDGMMLMDRLRQVDVKAEHFERQVTRAEQERDDWEQKHSVRFLLPLRRMKLTIVGGCREVPAIQARARRACRLDGRSCRFFHTLMIEPR
jgi:hypothetical protein